MNDNGYDFVIMVKGMKSLGRDLVFQSQGSFENDQRKSTRAFTVSRTTVSRKLYASDRKERYFHIYYDDRRKAAGSEKLEDKIDRMGRKLRDLIGEPFQPAGEHKKYFDLIFWHEGLQDEKFMSGIEQTDVTGREIRLCGYFVIITSAKITAEEAFVLFGSRDGSEKTFRRYKSYLGAHCERVYFNESVDTKIYTLLKNERARLDKNRIL